MELNREQFELIDRLARTHRDAHVRSRALAVRAVALGYTRQQVAAMMPYSAYWIGQWCRDFVQYGPQALAIAPGRGRLGQTDEREVLAALRQSPRHFGLEQTRWSLAALGQACPSLSGMSERGIKEVINRLGFHYKRGQPWIHSPDPCYEEKKSGHRGGLC